MIPAGTRREPVPHFSLRSGGSITLRIKPARSAGRDVICSPNSCRFARLRFEAMTIACMRCEGDCRGRSRKCRHINQPLFLAFPLRPRPLRSGSARHTAMESSWMRLPMLKIISLHVPRRTRWTSVANVANQRNTAIARAVGQIVGTISRPNPPAKISAPQTTTTTSRYPPSAVRPDGNSRLKSPSITNTCQPALSMSTLFKALRQSQPSRTTSETPSR